MTEIQCIEKCGNLTEENSVYCSTCKPIIKPRKKDAHVQLFKRYAKTLFVLDLVKFVSRDVAFVPSKKEMSEKGHYAHFGPKKQYCECSSFTFGFSADPNFACYHIIAARLKFKLSVSPETWKLMGFDQ